MDIIISDIFVTDHIAELGHIAESRTSQSYAIPRCYVD